MIKRLKNIVRNRIPDVSVARGFAKSVVRRVPLPPGSMVPIFSKKKENRRWLLTLSAQLGSVTKAYAWNKIFVSVVGNDESRIFLAENESKCSLKTMDVTSMVPKGYLRQMTPEDHKYYRSILVRALSSKVFVSAEKNLSRYTLQSLSDYGEKADLDPAEFTQTLSRIATGMLVELFLGHPAGTHCHSELVSLYHEMGPKGLAWIPGKQQEDAYFNIKEVVSKNLSSVDQDCMINRISSAHDLDDTILGNLIYMIEMGRFDMYSLFRWVSSFCSRDLAILERLSSEAKEGRTDVLARAVIYETLRMEQSERLVRDVHEDIEFKGFLIPRDSVVGLSLWESHKDESIFKCPFDFDPERFVDRKYSTDEYAPFGMGKHICPLADFSIRLGAIFVNTLACNFRVRPIGDGPAHRGRYHWEPAKKFSIQLTPR